MDGKRPQQQQQQEEQKQEQQPQPKQNNTWNIMKPKVTNCFLLLFEITKIFKFPIHWESQTVQQPELMGKQNSDPRI